MLKVISSKTPKKRWEKINLPRNAFIFNVFFYNTAITVKLCCVKRDGKQKKKKTVLDHSSTQPEKRKENERKNRNLKKEILESE